MIDAVGITGLLLLAGLYWLDRRLAEYEIKRFDSFAAEQDSDDEH